MTRNKKTNKEEKSLTLFLMSDAMRLGIIQNLQEYTKEVENDFLLGSL